MTTLNWLHLSDWHQRGREFERTKIRDALMRDIEARNRLNPRLDKIDFVVVSGDIAYSGKSEEYETAITEFFTPLIEVAGVTKERLFLVPGNHDLDRAALELMPENLPQKLNSSDTVNEWLTNERKRNTLLMPMEAYSRFVKNYIGGEFLVQEPAYGYVRHISAGDKNIAVLGLNTAWLCAHQRDAEGKVQDRGNLILGEAQVYDTIMKSEDAEVRIAIVHHPFDWLVEFDQHRLAERLGKHCHFILRGHLHLPQATVLQGTGGHSVIVPAGASYNRETDPRYANAYNFAHLNFATGKGLLYLRRWSARRENWIADTDTSDNGIFSFTLPKDLSKATRKKNYSGNKTYLPKSSPYTQDDLNNYLTFIESQCATLDPRRMPRGSKTHDVVLPLKDVFITLKAGQNNPLERQAEQNLLDLEVEELVQHLRLTESEGSVSEFDFRYQKLAEECMMLSERLRERTGVVNLQDAFCKHRWLVILGEPGSGKSTLLQWLSFQFARALLTGQERVAVLSSQLGNDLPENLVDLGPARLPILVRIADYANELHKDSSLTLLDYLGKQPILGQHPVIPKNKVEQLCLDFIKRGKSIVLLDGLDEITDPEDRRRIRDRIEEFVKDYIKDPKNENAFLPWATTTPDGSPSGKWWIQIDSSIPTQVGGNQVVITSRIAGYKAAVLRSEFTHYVIEPLDDESVVRFCKEWTLAVERYLARQSSVTISDTNIEHRASEEARSLIESILHNKSIRKLASNPLLLTLLALLNREQSRLPTQRIRLYGQAVKALIERRDAELDEALVNDVLGPFALWLHENQPTGLATEAELRSLINNALSRWHGLDTSKPIAGKFSKEVDAFIISAREQSGLLAARGEGLYGFLHLTFQEYFVARELTRDPDQVASRLVAYLHRPRWREPLLFAIAYISDTQRGILERVMLSVLNADSKYEEILHRNLIFAADCVADCIWMPPSILENITTSLLSIYADKTGQGRFISMRDQIVTAFERIYRQDTAMTIEKIFIDALYGFDSEVRDAASEILERVAWGSSELFIGLFRAMNLPSVPLAVFQGFIAMSEKISSPKEKLPQYGLDTLENLYINEPGIANAIDSLLENSTIINFLRDRARTVNPFITPLIIETLKGYETNTTEGFATVFLKRLSILLKAFSETSAGFAYSSTIEALLYFEESQLISQILIDNITEERKVDESIFLLLNDPRLSTTVVLDDWWNRLSTRVRQRFFEIALDTNSSQWLVEKAWSELSVSNSELLIYSLKLLLGYPNSRLTLNRVRLLKPHIDGQSQELAEIAGDLLDRAVFPESGSELEDIVLELRSWLKSERQILIIYAGFILADIDKMSVDVYDAITLALESNNDRFRQWASRILSRNNLISDIPFEVIKVSAQRDWISEHEKNDGLASLAHSTFKRMIIYNSSENLFQLAEQLRSPLDEKNKEILQSILSSINLCTPEVIIHLGAMLNKTSTFSIQEALVGSFSWILRLRYVAKIPDTVILSLAKIIKETDNDKLRLQAADTLGLLAFVRPEAYDTLHQLYFSELSNTIVAAIHGIGTLALYLNDDQPFKEINLVDGQIRSSKTFRYPFDKDRWESEILNQLRKIIAEGNLDLRAVTLSAYARALLASDKEPKSVLDALMEIVNTDTELLRALFAAGEGDDLWDSITCQCGRYFHSKLIEVLSMRIIMTPDLLEELVNYVLQMLDLPSKLWDKKRVPLAVLATCAEELPASLSRLNKAIILQEILLDTAKDPYSFTMRRYSIVTLSQFRTVNARILDALAAGCRDLAIVQEATLKAIRSFRRIETNSVPELVQMLSNPSLATVYATALVMKEIGSSHQAIREHGVLDSIVNGLGDAIRGITYPRYVRTGEDRIILLDDILFTTLLQITSDYPQEAIGEKDSIEGNLEAPGLREQVDRTIFTGIERMRSQASILQKELAAEKLQVVETGWVIVITGDQIFEVVEFEGKKHPELIEVLSEAIRLSQKFATEELMNISKIAGDNILDNLEDENIRNKVVEMQQRLELQEFQIEKSDWKVVITGGQQIKLIEFNGEQKDGLLNALNTAIKESQKLAAKKLFKLSNEGSSILGVDNNLGNWIKRGLLSRIDEFRNRNGAEEPSEHKELGLINISIPCEENWIEDITKTIDDSGFLHFVITPSGQGFPFNEEDVVFTRSSDLTGLKKQPDVFPKPKREPRESKLFVSIPYKDDLISDVSYRLEFGHLNITVTSAKKNLSFCELDVNFTRGSRIPNLKKRKKSSVINLSIPYLDDSIDKVSYEIHNEYFDLVLLPRGDGFSWKKKDIIFSRGLDLPSLTDEQLGNFKQRKANLLSRFIISIPYTRDGCIQTVSYNIADNYFHLTIIPAKGFVFDKRKWRFSSSTEISEKSQEIV